MIFLQSKELSRVFFSSRVQKPSVLWCSAFFMVQLSYLYMTTGKTVVLTIRIFVGKVMSLLFKMLPRFVSWAPAFPLVTSGCWGPPALRDGLQAPVLTDPCHPAPTQKASVLMCACPWLWGTPGLVERGRQEQLWPEAQEHLWETQCILRLRPGPAQPTPGHLCSPTLVP